MKKIIIIIFLFLIVSCNNDKNQYTKVSEYVYKTCVDGHEFVIFNRENHSGGITQHFDDNGKPVKCKEIK